MTDAERAYLASYLNDYNCDKEPKDVSHWIWVGLAAFIVIAGVFGLSIVHVRMGL